MKTWEEEEWLAAVHGAETPRLAGRFDSRQNESQQADGLHIFPTNMAPAVQNTTAMIPLFAPTWLFALAFGPLVLVCASQVFSAGSAYFPKKRPVLPLNSQGNRRN